MLKSEVGGQELLHRRRCAVHLAEHASASDSSYVSPDLSIKFGTIQALCNKWNLKVFPTSLHNRITLQTSISALSSSELHDFIIR